MELDPSLWLDLSDVAESQRTEAWRSWMEASFPEFSLLSSTPGCGGARGLPLGAARLWLVNFPAGMTLRGAPGERFRRDTIALAAALELLPLPLLGVRARDAHVTRVERILASIDERLSEERLTPERLAHQQGISRRRLDELFVSALGMPVAACIAERRLAIGRVTSCRSRAWPRPPASATPRTSRARSGAPSAPPPRPGAPRHSR